MELKKYNKMRPAGVIWTFLLITASLIVGVQDSQAALLEQMVVNTRGISMGNALTADPGGPMAVHYNPAALTQLRGKQIEMGLSVPDFGVRASFTKPKGYKGFFGYDQDPVAGTTTETKGMAINIPFSGPASMSKVAGPATAFSWHPAGTKWTVGLAVLTPSVGGFEFPSGPAVYGAQHLHLQRIALTPSIGYKLTETLSIGASIGIGTAAMGARMEMRAPNDLVALTGLLGAITQDLDDVITLGLIPFPLFGGGIKPFESIGRMTATNLQDNLSTSYSIGLLWEPWDWFAAGVCYQSESKARLGGTFMLEYSQSFQNMMDWLVSNELIAVFTQALGLPTEGGVPFQRGRATVEFEFPRRVQGGIKFQPFKMLKLTADASWFQGSSMEANVFQFDRDIQLLKVAYLLGYKGGNRTLILKREAKDTIEWHFGAEIMVPEIFHPFDWMVLRLGYEDRKSSVNKKFLDVMMPLPDVKVYCAGLGFKLTRDATVDLGYAYGAGEPMRSHQEDSTTSLNMNTRDFTAIIYNPYAGLNVDMKMSFMILSAGITYRF